MGRNREMLAVGLALVIIAAAATIYAFVGGFAAADRIRVEDPYERTAEDPPSAVPDRTSHPALRN